MSGLTSLVCYAKPIANFLSSFTTPWIKKHTPMCEEKPTAIPSIIAIVDNDLKIKAIYDECKSKGELGAVICESNSITLLTFADSYGKGLNGVEKNESKAERYSRIGLEFLLLARDIRKIPTTLPQEISPASIDEDFDLPKINSLDDLFGSYSDPESENNDTDLVSSIFVSGIDARESEREALPTFKPKPQNPDIKTAQAHRRQRILDDPDDIPQDIGGWITLPGLGEMELPEPRYWDSKQGRYRFQNDRDPETPATQPQENPAAPVNELPPPAPHTVDAAIPPPPGGFVPPPPPPPPLVQETPGQKIAKIGTELNTLLVGSTQSELEYKKIITALKLVKTTNAQDAAKKQSLIDSCRDKIIGIKDLKIEAQNQKIADLKLEHNKKSEDRKKLHERATELEKEKKTPLYASFQKVNSEIKNLKMSLEANEETLAQYRIALNKLKAGTKSVHDGTEHILIEKKLIPKDLYDIRLKEIETEIEYLDNQCNSKKAKIPELENQLTKKFPIGHFYYTLEADLMRSAAQATNVSNQALKLKDELTMAEKVLLRYKDEKENFVQGKADIEIAEEEKVGKPTVDLSQIGQSKAGLRTTLQVVKRSTSTTDLVGMLGSK